MLFRRVSSSNYPKSTKTWPFLFISHACPVFLKYALRDQKLYPISFSGFFLTNMIGSYLFFVIFEFFFIGNICNRKPINHEFAFICLALCFILTTFLFDYTAFKSGNFIKYFSPSLYCDSLLNTYDFSNFIFSNFMVFFRKLPYHFMIGLCLVFKALYPFRIHVC